MASTSKGAASKVKFGTPPPKREPRYDWEKIATTLRAKPGDWALIFEGDRTSLATAIRINGIKALRADRGFEVRTSNNKREPVRTCDLWLRYVPANDKEK